MNGMCTRAEGEIIRETYLDYKDGKLVNDKDRRVLDILVDAHRIEYHYTKNGIFAQAVKF